MPPLSLPETLQRALGLNSEKQPFQFTTTANQIIGNWKIADVQWIGLFSQGSIDKQYKIVVDLDEATHTYKFQEYRTDSVGGSSFNPVSGGLSFGKSGSFFKGKMTGKEFGAGGALSVTQNGQPAGQAYRYTFDTSKIKQPLFDTLAQCGWQPAKKGFFSRLFSH